MHDPRVDAVADVLVRYSVDLQPGQLVQIQANVEGAPLVVALYQAILQAGGHPWVDLSIEETEELFYNYATDAQLDFHPDFLKQADEAIEASISVWTDANSKRLTNVDAAKQARRAKAMHPVISRFFERMANKEIRWVGTAFPTNAAAQTAEMSLRDYENFVYGACLVAEPDPIAAWKAVSVKQQRWIDWLSDRHEIHLEGEDTDLRLIYKGRTWENCDGRENFPDGEIFTGPIEDSVEGHIRFTYPACYRGRQVEDVRLWFEKGKVVKATAAKNEAFLLEMLAIDDGARFVGEFAFGTNPGIQAFTGDTLFDEKIGGTVHLALGKGYLETGSKNDSAIHWDMVCDLRQGGRVRVNGETFSENGQLLI
ncbi:aminopeptidase [Candidatus Bipolaricaulota bacterium]|nr:aminopeptidase [Candidatus Bipolaricaulota bacterium]